MAKIKSDKEKEEEAKKAASKKPEEAPSTDSSKKPPTGLSKGALDEMVKIGGRLSPKGGGPDKEARNRFASHIGAPT